jgi:argininosuccinate lyase
MAGMLKETDQQLAQQDAWIKATRGTIDASLARLDRDFGKLLK